MRADAGADVIVSVHGAHLVNVPWLDVKRPALFKSNSHSLSPSSFSQSPPPDGTSARLSLSLLEREKVARLWRETRGRLSCLFAQPGALLVEVLPWAHSSKKHHSRLLEHTDIIYAKLCGVSTGAAKREARRVLAHECCGLRPPLVVRWIPLERAPKPFRANQIKSRISNPSLSLSLSDDDDG